MNYYVLTLFPEMIEKGMNTSILGRAMEKNLIHLSAIDIRDFSENKHSKVDDYPYGGGAGMLMQSAPVYGAYQKALEEIEMQKDNETKMHIQKETDKADISSRTRVIYLTPQGTIFNQKMAKELAQEENLIFLCGHYEGIDERVLDEIVTDHISIGDYVLTGGELPAMVLMDSIARLVPGVLNNDVSAETESFSESLLEYPQYTRPEIWHGQSVPQILLSGHHANILKWKKEKSLQRTMERRPDLFHQYEEKIKTHNK